MVFWFKRLGATSGREERKSWKPRSPKLLRRVLRGVIVSCREIRVGGVGDGFQEKFVNSTTQGNTTRYHWEFKIPGSSVGSSTSGQQSLNVNLLVWRNCCKCCWIYFGPHNQSVYCSVCSWTRGRRGPVQGTRELWRESLGTGAPKKTS